MNKEIQFAKELIEFIYNSPSAFHVVESVKSALLPQGFKELKQEDKWCIEKGGKYFVTQNSSAIIAFVVGEGEVEEEGFRIIGSHTDSPSFRIKPYSVIVSENSYVKLNTEIYGGPILSTWMDRPLSLAGRVVLKGKDMFKPVERLINIKKPILIIPNLAIHLNRDVNSGIALNGQKDMLPLIGQINDEFEKDNYLLNIISEELNVEVASILDFDLFLYEYEKGQIIGMKEEFISSSRLDNTAMVHASLTALLQSDKIKATKIIACFDNEEVGSSTKQGADSEILSSTIERILICLNKDREDYFRALNNSFVISADLAHAVHPNVPEKHDPTSRPLINKGPVIKISANQRYTTDSISSSIYGTICDNADVPYQKFVNRSDERGGSTIGPILSTHLPIKSVDIGTPILSMHSIRELGGVLDHTYIKDSFKYFFS